MIDLAPSVRICEVLDGPYKGHIVRVGVRARYVDVRPLFSDAPLERYEVVEMGKGCFDLRYRSREVVE
jgi:hypothetical protein